MELTQGMTRASPKPFTAGKTGGATRLHMAAAGSADLARHNKRAAGRCSPPAAQCTAGRRCRTCAGQQSLAQRAAEANGGSHDAPQQASKGHDIGAVVAVAHKATDGRGQRLQGSR